MKSFKELKRNLKHESDGLQEINVALLGDTATQLLAVAIQGMGVDYGFHINLFETEYNQVERQLMDKNSELYLFKADYIVIFQSTHKWNEHYCLASQTERYHIADTRINFIKDICKEQKAKIIYFNYPEIDDTVFGSYANKVETSFTYQTRKFNYELMELARQTSNLFVCDLAAIQNKWGRNFMFDASIYATTEMILSLDALPHVASRVMDIISAAQGRLKKCLILDLDNTLWGGIIGDDGIENIKLGHELGIGKVFVEFQQWIKKLKERGIILCVCSKNDEATAKEPFEKHPNMILRLSDISVFIANWETKVDNIRTVQKILNIGFDSMVFLDDNPFERNIIKENIPDICVPDLPEDPADYLEYLYTLNLFETISYSGLDSDRTRQYQLQAARTAFLKTFDNEDDFLKSLQMVSKVEGFNSFNTPRVAQLSQRSNQFNLRSIRYTETEISALANDKDAICLTFTLKDKFGENGLISVVIMKMLNQNTLFIDTWFMSCRVLKRGMENFVLNKMVQCAKDKGFRNIIGEYLPTMKNKMVEKHYPNLGFVHTEDMPINQYVLEIDNYIPHNCFIQERNG